MKELRDDMGRFVDGELTCLCNHRDYRNCDLYKKDEEIYDGWGEEDGSTTNMNYR